MDAISSLEQLSEELRDMPRHLWDEYLWQYCEQLLSRSSEHPPEAGYDSASRLQSD